ncbi:PREDICTED: two-component response regulator-like APRR5 [Ipomoea nil]|uniref:two-component response regulator-like APRR5 n=1 Tax=Ipomoea nil TaxID=35883 RepID=UPI000900E0D2|nr:PREDICTED: two-component response regulator-like APRR5 [Ipomoea nil]
MGEVVVSGEGGAAAMELEVLETEEVEVAEVGQRKAEERDGLVRWERFLPKMVLRVLLVESDDSTRQIIAALLRKCNYRVAAVPDGLKAWEVLKGRPRNVDLILTEVDLPSISGYALLTLIMEHEICKNIPVIMMSAYDSVSTVYRCMLRGAADFLVKPVRKNELRNLWQHVWRRQATSKSGQGPGDESVAQLKVEATAENNDFSNHSSGYKACIERNRECIEKGSDAQSSCTKPEMETGEENTKHIQEFGQPDWNKPRPVDADMQKEEQHRNPSDQVEGTSNDNCCHLQVIGQASGEDPATMNSSKRAIDLIGTFDNHGICTYVSGSNISPNNKVDSPPPLELSLTRYPSGSVNQFPDEKHKLNHSDASAFTRYVSKGVQPQPQPRDLISPNTRNEHKESETDSDKRLSVHNSDPTASSHRLVPPTNFESGQAETRLPSPGQRVLSAPIPVRGVRFEGLSNAYTFMTSPMQSPGSAGHQNSPRQANTFHRLNHQTINSQQCHRVIEQNVNTVSTQTEYRQGYQSEPDRGHFSSATDQSANSSLCNGVVNCHYNGGGSNGRIPVTMIKSTAEYRNDEASAVQDANSQRSQREAALNKFRLKRKDRCYEKKVRYESRKKLAEQRPRVKGQFVRQLPSEPPPGDT